MIAMPQHYRTSVVSFYMDNISDSVTAAQDAVIRNFIPPGFAFEQIRTNKSHSDSLDDYIRDSSSDVVIFLDIDCVPLHSNALLELSAYAARGELVGSVQRATHIENGGHLYVGPFCMALSRRLWDDIGRPSFAPTPRGDVGEEITYRCETKGIPIRFIWPSAVGDPVWHLTDGIRFGLNTEYGCSFFHAFTIRQEENRQNFIAYCQNLSTSPISGARFLDWSKPTGIVRNSDSGSDARSEPCGSRLEPYQESNMRPSTSHTVLKNLQHDKENLKLLKLAKEERCEIYNEESRGYHDFGNDWWVNDRSPYSFKYIEIDSLYPEVYFGSATGHPSDQTASQIYKYMQQVYQGVFGRAFQSVLELGTGGGEITREFHRHGLDYLAVEGTRFGVQHLLQAGIQESRISQQNLKFMERVGRTFDLAMCTETAEHIEPFFASKIVDNCIQHAEVVWFSAADRNRPAHYHHINEQAIEVWDNLFAHMGFNFFVPLNGLHGRASRLYLSERLGEYLQLPSASRGTFRPG